MRKLLLLLLLAVCFVGHTQTDTGTTTTLFNKDSMSVQDPQFVDSMAKAIQIKQDQASMDRNLSSLIQYQQKSAAKQKKEAFIRIGIGIAFLVIMVIGLMRRRKAKK